MWSNLWGGSQQQQQQPQHQNQGQCHQQSMMKSVGFDSVIALAANSKHGIWVIQSDKKLYHKADLKKQAKSFSGKWNHVTHLQDTEKAIVALFKNGTISYCMYPCKNEGGWKSLTPSQNANNEIPISLFDIRGNLGLKTSSGAIYVYDLTSGRTTTLNTGKMSIKSIVAPSNSTYSLVIDDRLKLYLNNVTENQGAETKLGHGFTSAVLSHKFVYAFNKSEKMILRCKLPCGQKHKLKPFVAGTKVLMATFKGHLLACIKGNPLISIKEGKQQQQQPQQQSNQADQQQSTQYGQQQQEEE